MTREDLRGIIEGISDEALKKILDINSSDIGKAKENVEELKTRLEESTKKATELEEKVSSLSLCQCEADEMKEKVKELQKVIDEREEKEREDTLKAELNRRFEQARGDKNFVNEFTRNGIFEQFKDAISDEKNACRADSEIYGDLISGRDNIFLQDESVPKVVASTPGFLGSITESDVREIMGLS